MRRMVSTVKICGAALAASVLASPAASEEWLQASQSAVRLIEGPSTGAGDHAAALEFRIRPGWKTYWRVPGEAGIPPSFDFSGSENVASVEAVWPRPEIFDSFGFQTIGYSDALVVPLKVTPADPDKPVRLSAALFWGVCADICVPEEAAVAVSLDGTETPGAGPIIAAAEANAPERLEADAAVCKVAGAGDQRDFTARLKLDPPLSAPPLVVVEGPEDAWFGATSIEMKDDEVHVAAPVEIFADNLWIDRSELTLTVLAGDRSIEIAGCGASFG